MRAFTTSLLTLLVVSGCSEYDLSAKQEPVEAGEPRIQVTPQVLDFGDVRVDQLETGFFQIENVGENKLVLGDLTINGSNAFTLTTDAHGAELDPGDTVDAMVEYIGTTQADTGRVLIPSNDGSQPEAQVQLNGGVADADKPVAVCSVDPNEVTAISGVATLIGDQSYDPNGQALTYQWAGALRPAGSNAVVPGAPETQANIPGFVPDLVGTYGFELVVVNEQGYASDPCFAELDAVPGEDLWVEMFWATSGDDMDLHLTRDGGALNSNNDCYFANCTNGRDWGPGGAAGNPILDLDDIPGTGPENINVDTPENVVYGVWVHDHTSRNYQGANAVTVNIYMGGVLAWTDTRDISGEDSQNHFADVDWAAQNVIPR